MCVGSACSSLIASQAYICTVVYLSPEFQGKGSEECTVACGAGGLTLFCRPVRSRSRPPWLCALLQAMARHTARWRWCWCRPLHPSSSFETPITTILPWCCWSGTWSGVERAHTRMHARSSSICRCPAHHASGGPLPPVGAQLQPSPRHIGSQPRGASRARRTGCARCQVPCVVVVRLLCWLT